MNPRIINTYINVRKRRKTVRFFKIYRNRGEWGNFAHGAIS